MGLDSTAEADQPVSSPCTEDAPHHSPAQGAPAVLATSRLCEFMEMAASRLMWRELSSHENSVAIRTNLEHVATSATVAGRWRVVATRTAIRGRLHDFRVDVFDDSGLIASAEHTRAVVVERRLVAVARRRAGQPSMLLTP